MMYFTCMVPGHCLGGQKVKIEPTGTSTASSATAPSSDASQHSKLSVGTVVALLFAVTGRVGSALAFAKPLTGKGCRTLCRGFKASAGLCIALCHGLHHANSCFLLQKAHAQGERELHLGRCHGRRMGGDV